LRARRIAERPKCVKSVVTPSGPFPLA